MSASVFLSPVYTGDFCRATRYNVCRAEVASSFKHVRNFGDIAATNSQVVYTRDFKVATQSATKIASSCTTKIIACVNGTLAFPEVLRTSRNRDIKHGQLCLVLVISLPFHFTPDAIIIIIIIITVIVIRHRYNYLHSNYFIYKKFTLLNILTDIL